MQALRTSASDYEQFKDRNPKRVEGTCEWVLHHPNFQNWKDSSSSSLLWVSADPGCGKSTLSKSLVDIDLKPTDARTTCYFFFKDDNDAQKSLATALSALLHQLFCQKQRLIKYAMSEFAANGDKLPQLIHTLWDILIKAAGDPEAGEVFCILDALDECTEGGRYQIISALSTLYQKEGFSKTIARLKICVTSRPYLDIERRFTDLTSNFPTIRLLGEQESDAISREIDLVIQQRVSQFGSELKLNDLERSNLETELLRMAHRTYLWLTLIFDIIRKITRPTTRNLKAAIGTLPSTVYDAYEAILARVKEDDRKQAQKLLHIIVATTRPLTLNEMNIALAIEDHYDSYDNLEPDLDDEARFEVTVKSLCGLFVIVVDQKVYLIHQTAKEFLVAKNEAVATGWKHSLGLIESETLLARICLTYLTFIEYDRTTGSTSTTAKYGFLGYAASSWASHYREVQHAATEEMLKLALRVCQCAATWFNVYWNGSQPWVHNPGFTSPLTVGSYFGLETVVKLLLEGGADVESRDNKYSWTPLLWATMRGHEAVVELLLEGRADVESRDDEGETPLSWAVIRGHEALVKLLLKGGADVESRDKYGGTPLLRAAKRREEALVKLLLKAGADVESRDKYGGTPLLWAAVNGHEALVKLLLKAGADVESRDDEGETPLLRAAKRGHEAVVKLLLEGGANVESRDSKGQTPLSWAVGIGHEAVVKLLLEGGANVESRDSKGQTPLSWAVGIGHEAVVKLLLKGGANVDSRNVMGSGTPLSWAAMRGHEAEAKLLLEGGADVEPRDKYGGTPLLWAAVSGHEAVVKLLLKGGADVESRDSIDQTPLLSWAAAFGHEAVVKLLLKGGADVESRDNDGGAPLSWAAAFGHEAVVKLLLEAGADVDSRDDDGETPLSWAVDREHEAVVELLLEGGANVDSGDADGKSPLSWAATKGQEAVVKLLLRGGANIESRDGKGRTPLSQAARSGDEAVVKLLLETGADVDSRDDDGETPLSWAVDREHEAVVELLLRGGANVDSRDKYGRTPLSWAAEGLDEAVVKLLLEAGADVESRDDEGRTPLSWAADVDSWNVDDDDSWDVDDDDYWTLLKAVAKAREAMVKLLLEGGANIESRDGKGRTPLSQAARRGDEAVVKLLLEGGANVDSGDDDGETPLSWAAANGQEAVVKLLQSFTHR
jgi:ankyrin repeat protein